MSPRTSTLFVLSILAVTVPFLISHLQSSGYLPSSRPTFDLNDTTTGTTTLKSSDNYLGIKRKNTQNEMAAASISRSVAKKVFAVETPEGAGAIVRRSIGSMSLRNLSPFLMLDHFSVGEGAGFPDHPHRGQVTVTYMLEGSFQHEDSAGHAGTINPGDLQWMTAGRGVIHAEMPVHGPGLPTPVGLQLWVDLPKQHKMTPPTYQELKDTEIPRAYPEGQDGAVEVKIISGESFGVTSPVRSLGGCWYMDIKLKKKGATFFQDLPKGWTTFLYTLTGSLGVNYDNDSKVHEPYHTLVLSSATNETGVHLSAQADDTRFVLIAGEPLDQPVVQYGPFVLTNREEVQKTLLDYQMGQNGFEKAHSWKSKIGGR